jgi:hypothetical protein
LSTLNSGFQLIIIIIIYLLQLGFHPAAVASTFVYTAQWSTHNIMKYTENSEYAENSDYKQNIE